MVSLEFIFRLVLYSHKDVSSNTIFLNVFEGIKQFNLSMRFMKTRLETPFTGDNVAFIKRQIVKNGPLFSEKVHNIAAFAMLFWFSVTKQSLENVFGFPQ